MKHILFSIGLAAITSINALNVNAATPGEILNSLATPINNALAAASNSPAPNARLTASLKKAAGLVARASATDLAADLKLLSQITGATLRTTASNSLGAPVQSVVDAYLGTMYDSATTASNLLLAAFPSGQRTAATRNLAQLNGLLQAADQSTDLIAAVSTLNKAVVKLKVVNGLVTKARAVPPPPANVTATITFSGAPSTGSIHYRSRGAGITQGAPGYFIVNSATVAGSGFHSEQQTITFGLAGLVAGANTVAINGAAFTYVSLQRHGVFGNGTGTAQVTWNPDTHVLAGTFDFVASEQNTSRTAHVQGSFSGTY